MSDLNMDPREIADFSPDQRWTSEPEDFPPSTQDTNDGRREGFATRAQSQVAACEQQGKTPQLGRGRELGFFAVTAKRTRNDGKASEKWLKEHFNRLIDQVECKGPDDWLGVLIAAVLTFPAPGSPGLKNVINHVAYTAVTADIDKLKLGGIPMSPLASMRSGEALRVETAWSICRSLWKDQAYLLHRVAMNAATHHDFSSDQYKAIREEVHDAPQNRLTIQQTFQLFDKLRPSSYFNSVKKLEKYLKDGKYLNSSVGTADWCVADMDSLFRPNINHTPYDVLIGQCRVGKKEVWNQHPSIDGDLASDLLAALEECNEQRKRAEARAADIVQRFKYVAELDARLLEAAVEAMKKKTMELN